MSSVPPSLIRRRNVKRKPLSRSLLLDWRSSSNRAGLGEDYAHDFIEENAERYAMNDEIESLEFEFIRLCSLFKNIEIAPLFVSLSTTRLHLPVWFDQYK